MMAAPPATEDERCLARDHNRPHHIYVQTLQDMPPKLIDAFSQQSYVT